MKTTKNRNKDNAKKPSIIDQYNEIMRLLPELQSLSQPISNLEQPSLFEKIDSITTYSINGF